MVRRLVADNLRAAAAGDLGPAEAAGELGAMATAGELAALRATAGGGRVPCEMWWGRT